MIRIYGHQLVVDPSRNDRKVGFEQTRTGRKGLHRNSERHVRFAVGRHPRQRTVTVQSSPRWIPPDDPHTRIMDTRYLAHIILVSNG
jgi:hypothetical protein